MAESKQLKEFLQPLVNVIAEKANIASGTVINGADLLATAQSIPSTEELQRLVKQLIDGTLVHLVIPEGVTHIKDSFMSGNQTIKTVKCPSTLKTIGKSAFSGSTLNSISFNEGLESIGQQAFYGLKRIYGDGYLTTVSIPGTVKTIGNSAFSNNDGAIQRIILNDGVETIEASAFYDNNAVNYIYFTKSIKTFNQYSFMFSYDYASVNLSVYYKGTIEDWFTVTNPQYGPLISPAAGSYGGGGTYNRPVNIYFVDDLGNNVAPSNENVYVPSGVTTILEGQLYPFIGATNSTVSTLNIPEGVTKMEYIINAAGTQPTGTSFRNISVYVPSTVTEVTVPFRASSGFFNVSVYYNGTLNDYFTKIENNTMPSSTSKYSIFTSVQNAYYKDSKGDYRKLEGVLKVPSTVTDVSEGSLEGLPLNVYAIEIEEGVLTVKGRIVATYTSSNDYNYEYLKVPSTVYNLCNDYSGAIRAKVLIVKATIPPTIYNSSTLGVGKIIVPAGCADAYKSATNWSAHASIIFTENIKTVNIAPELLNNENYVYKTDTDEDFKQFTQSQIIVENSSAIIFKNNTADTTILIGTTNGGSDVGTIANAMLTYTSDTDATIYLTIQ